MPWHCYWYVHVIAYSLCICMYGIVLTRDVVLGLDLWFLVILKDKIGVLGLALALKVKSLALLALALNLLSLVLALALRLQSLLTLIMRPNRACMSNSLLETLVVFLKCNSSLFV